MTHSSQTTAASCTPGIVVARVEPDSVAVALQPLLKVLVRKVLMARQRVGVDKRRVQLQSALEKAQRVLVLLRGGWPMEIQTLIKYINT